MFVAPVPVILLILLFELGEIGGFAMTLFCIDAICLIFLGAPCMVVIVLFVVIGSSGPLILGSQWDHRNWGYQGGTQQGYVPETAHVCFPLRVMSICRANHPLTPTDGPFLIKASLIFQRFGRRRRHTRRWREKAQIESGFSAVKVQDLLL
jgi:hypothetical protein